LNKVNLCWVFTEGRKGHDIQSLTLANALGHEVAAFGFTLSQPWLTAAPGLLPWMNRGIRWNTQGPDWLSQHPELIITTGRRAAAVGRFVTKQLRRTQLSCHHIQVLNPHNHPAHYDLLLVPEHDLIRGPRVLPFRGSIHPYTRHWHRQRQDTAGFGQCLALLLGQPGERYWRTDFPAELHAIRKAFPGVPAYVCGSPRLDPTVREGIKSALVPGDQAWFSDADGSNPYLSLLSHAHKLFVTADSINMVNECLASPRPGSLLALNTPLSSRHQRFIDQVAGYFCALEELQSRPIPQDSIDQILQHPKLLELIRQT
jgi:mitochondrial fission protein ELM1